MLVRSLSPIRTAIRTSCLLAALAAPLMMTGCDGSAATGVSCPDLGTTDPALKVRAF